MNLKKIIQVFTIISGILGTVWFLIPFLKKRILNIGNKTGLIFFLGVFLYGINFNKINNIIKIYNKKLSGKIVTAILGTGLILDLSILITILKLMKNAVFIKPEKNATVIVLGCRVYGEEPSLMLIERLDAAYKYLNKNHESSCILSGGQGNDENISEAECMYRYLINKGISKERLYKEEKSVNTYQNIFYSKEIIEENNLNKNIAIATNEFHEYRAIKEARRLNIDAGAIPGKTEWWLLPTFFVREIYSIIYNM